MSKADKVAINRQIQTQNDPTQGLALFHKALQLCFFKTKILTNLVRSMLEKPHTQTQSQRAQQFRQIKLYGEAFFLYTSKSEVQNNQDCDFLKFQKKLNGRKTPQWNLPGFCISRVVPTIYFPKNSFSL
jgi:hypothetical protein